LLDELLGLRARGRKALAVLLDPDDFAAQTSSKGMIDQKKRLEKEMITGNQDP